MPTTFSGVRRERLLHRNDRSDVWLARTPADGALVVVKRCVSMGDARLQAALRREAEVLAVLAHPHVVRLIGVDEDASGPVLVLAPVAGGSLRDLLDDQGTLTPGAVVAVLDGVAAAVGHLSAHGLVHGNLRPEHVLLTADGAPVLAGFGAVAGRAEGGPRLIDVPAERSKPGPAEGAVGAPSPVVDDPTYLHPRVARGGAADNRSEVYSVGVLAYECLTGRVPHRGTPAEVVALAEAEVHRPLSSWPSVPAGVATVVERALRPSGEGGPIDVADLVHRLRAVVDPATVVCPRPRVDPTRSTLGPALDETLSFGPVPAGSVDAGPPPDRWRLAAAIVIAAAMTGALWFLAGALLGV